MRADVERMMPWPYAAAHGALRAAIRPYATQPSPKDIARPVRGIGTALWFCSDDRLTWLHNGTAMQQTTTVALATLGGVAQIAVWGVCGAVLGAAAGVTWLRHGREAACRQLARDYAPVGMALTLTIVAGYGACGLGVCWLLGAVGRRL